MNTLIHADFQAPAPILVIKRPDSFSFRNPGRMRISIELARHGGLSDCRNRRLQTMFQQVGFGDLAGSGIPKIFTRWASRHWAQPRLQEDLEHELTTRELRMLSEDICSKPPEYAPETTGVEDEASDRNGQNDAETVISPPTGLYLDWEAVPGNQQARLLSLADPVARTKRVASSQLQAVILALCEGHFLGLQVLSHLLRRDPDDLRKRTLSPMVKAGLLRPAYPATNAPRQAYTHANPSTRSPQ